VFYKELLDLDIINVYGIYVNHIGVFPYTEFRTYYPKSTTNGAVHT